MKLMGIVAAVAALAVPCGAQTGKKVEVFTGKDISAQMAMLVQAAQAKGSSGAKLADYGSNAIQLSVRTKSGGAEVHAHFDDIFYVTQGQATLITGGTVLHAHTSSDGETHGTKIENGTSRTIGKGDVVEIPAGTPHQLIIPAGTTYGSIVIKVHEGS